MKKLAHCPATLQRNTWSFQRVVYASLSYMNGGKEPPYLRNISNLKTQRLELTNSKRDLGEQMEDITGNR